MTSTSGPAAQPAAGALPELRLEVFTSPARPIADGRSTWSPTTSTLVHGREDAVLIDAQFHREDVDALLRTIEATGKRLTTIFITHGHGDHYYGATRIAARWPGARIVASAGTVEYMRAALPKELSQFQALFGDDVDVPTGPAEPLDGDTIALEGHELHVEEVGQADIARSSVVLVPSLRAVIAGDVVYNGIHPMLALTGPDEWTAWLASIDAVERLDPRLVIAGHRSPDAADDDAARVLRQTRSYIEDFAAATAVAASPKDLVAAMREKYPEHGNVATLKMSAHAAVRPDA